MQRSGGAELHGELNERGEGGRLRDGAGRLRARVLQANKMQQKETINKYRRSNKSLIVPCFRKILQQFVPDLGPS